MPTNKPVWKNICPYRHTVNLAILPPLKRIPIPDYCNKSKKLPGKIETTVSPSTAIVP